MAQSMEGRRERELLAKLTPIFPVGLELQGSFQVGLVDGLYCKAAVDCKDDLEVSPFPLPSLSAVGSHLRWHLFCHALTQYLTM